MKITNINYDVKVNKCNSVGNLLNFADKLTPDPRDTRIVVFASMTSGDVNFGFERYSHFRFLMCCCSILSC